MLPLNVKAIMTSCCQFSVNFFLTLEKTISNLVKWVDSLVLSKSFRLQVQNRKVVNCKTKIVLKQKKK